MSFADKLKMQLNRRSLRPLLTPVLNFAARQAGHGVQRIFYEDGVWIHETSDGSFAYHQPYARLNLAARQDFTRSVFLKGYEPKPGDVIVDVGAGVGEEALTFSRAVGDLGKVICIEAHPRTFHCLEKLVYHNHLQNVIPIHQAVTEPTCAVATIEDSPEYLRNRVNCGEGIRVPASTIDTICRRLHLGKISFLKMNIEGAERLAIRGMMRTLRRTDVVCICCHDFLAEASQDNLLRTKVLVKRFLQESGFRVEQRHEPHLPPYVRDQVWGYNIQGLERAAG